MASNAEERLDLYLGTWYAASIGKGDQNAAFNAFQSLVQADQAFHDAAVARLASFDPGVLKRDHISRVAESVLRRILT